VNEAYARAFQRDVSEFPGHNHFEFYPHEENEPSSDESSTQRRLIKPLRDLYPFLITRAGSHLLGLDLIPLLNDRGETEFLVFSLEDVTGRVLTEKARDQLVQIIEATSDLVGMAKLDGQLFYLNQAGRKMLGFGEDEDISKIRISDAHPDWAASWFSMKVFQLLCRPACWSAETAFLRRDGTEFLASQVVIAQKGPTERWSFSPPSLEISASSNGPRKQRKLKGSGSMTCWNCCRLTWFC